MEEAKLDSNVVEAESQVEEVSEIDQEELEKEKVQEYYERNHWRITFKRMLRDWRLYVMLIPLALVFIFWRYLPMYGLLIAFKNFQNDGIISADFIGFAGFAKLWVDPLFWRAFRNTFMLSFYGLLFGFPFPIILALLFSEVKNQVYRTILQVLSYLPKFVSLVVVTTLITLLCAKSNETYSGGVITQLFMNLGWLPQGGNLLGDNGTYFRAIYQVSGIWEAAGYGSIVYFAAILSISPTSYEAARMDGANKWAQIRYVTFPGIASTLTIMLILEMGKMFTVGYEKVYLLYNDNMFETADIVSTYVMRNTGMSDGATSTSAIKYAMSSAADLFNALIAMLLVIGSNMVARQVSDTSLY